MYIYVYTKYLTSKLAYDSIQKMVLYISNVCNMHNIINVVYLNCMYKLYDKYVKQAESTNTSSNNNKMILKQTTHKKKKTKMFFNFSRNFVHT